VTGQVLSHPIGRPYGFRPLCDHYRVNRQTGSQLLSMMALVAAVVAIVILVFFGIGYLFGRMFL